MSTPTITEFLEARIAEDESHAWSELGAEYFVDGAWPEECAKRVLAECTAKRAIIEPFRLAHREPAELHPMVSDMAWLFLRPLAAVYADHPDYRQEWAL